MADRRGRIAQLRQQLGFTQAAFAHRIGVSCAMVGAYEAGTMAPRAKTLDRIAVVRTSRALVVHQPHLPA